MIKSSKSGFTLAEVLTTLMIIGVVAALTIPTLMNNTQNQQAAAATKKAVSVLSQSLQMLKAQEADCGTITTDADLATCFKTVMAGTRQGSQIITPDGFIYEFHHNNQDDGDINSACGGPLAADVDDNCVVIVDINGGKQGGLDAQQGNDKNQVNFAGANNDNPYNKSDKAILQMSDDTVRPAYVNGYNNFAYQYMNGVSLVDGNPYNEIYCCKGAGGANAVWTTCPNNNAYTKCNGAVYPSTSGQGCTGANDQPVPANQKPLSADDICPAPAPAN